MKTDMPEWLQKCLSCIHSYHKQDDADMIYCRCRNGNCNYKEKAVKRSKAIKKSDRK